MSSALASQSVARDSRLRLNDVDLFAPCVMRGAPLRDALQALERACAVGLETGVDVPDPTAPPVPVSLLPEIFPSHSTPQKPPAFNPDAPPPPPSNAPVMKIVQEEEPQTLDVECDLIITIDASAMYDVDIGCESKTPCHLVGEIELEKTNRIGDLPVPSGGTNFTPRVQINGKQIDSVQVIWQEEFGQKRGEELLHGRAFHVTQSMISVVLICGNDNVKVRFVFITEPCAVRDGAPHERRCERIEAQVDNMLRLLDGFNGLDALKTYYAKASELVDEDMSTYQVTFDMLRHMRDELQAMQAKAQSFCSEIQWLADDPMRQEYLKFMETMREQTQGIINLERELSTKFVSITEETLHDIFRANDKIKADIKEVLLTRNTLTHMLDLGRYRSQSRASAVDSRLAYLQLAVIDATLRRLCSCDGQLCGGMCTGAESQQEPLLHAWNLQQMYANNKFNSLKTTSRQFDELQAFIMKCAQMPCALPCVPGSRCSTTLQQHIITRSLVKGQALPFASSALFWYRTGQAFTMDEHPCVREAVGAFPPDSQAQARVEAIKLLTHMWLQDKTNRIIGLATYEHFNDILRQSNALSVPSCPRTPTLREDELLQVMDKRTHPLVRQALGLEWKPRLVNLSFLKPEAVFAEACSTGYDETRLPQLQLQLSMPQF